ncbi:MAG: FGGY-family carbohydrate kinase [Pseudomonadota bacterium]
MSDELIIGVDAGTSVIKAVAFDLDGRQIDLAAMPNRYEEGGGGAVEQDMAQTWQDTAKVLQQLGERVDRLAERTVALAVTGQGDGTWLLDSDCEPVAPAWLWLDSRSADIVEELDRSGARKSIYHYTGCGLNACQQSAQLIWLKRHAPQILARAATACHCKDWLYFNLTGVRCTDSSEGTFTFGDFRNRSYADEVLDALELSEFKRLLPPMIDGTQHTDPLSEQAARSTGLRTGTPVCLGFLDIICTALGGGLYEPDRTVGCSIVGSTGVHMCWRPVAKEVALADEPSGYFVPFPVPGSVSQMQSNMAATLNIDWIVDCAREAAEVLGLEVDRSEALAALDKRVLDGKPGAALFHPYIHEAGERGPFIDAAARAMFTGLSTRTGFLDLVRGVYEGLGLAARDCYGAIGSRPDEVRVAGGAARSRAFKTILASALDVPIRESAREESGAAGCAMMAAVAIGACNDMAAAARTWVEPLLGDRISPDPALARVYADLFPLYQQTRQAMQPAWHGLAAARAGWRT